MFYNSDNFHLLRDVFSLLLDMIDPPTRAQLLIDDVGGLAGVSLGP